MKIMNAKKESTSFKANAFISSLSNFMVSWVFLNSTNKFDHSYISCGIDFKKVKYMRILHPKLIKNLVLITKVKHYVLKCYHTKKIFNLKKLNKVISNFFVFKSKPNSIFYHLYEKVVLPYKIFSGWKNSLLINNSNILSKIFIVLKSKILSQNFTVNFHRIHGLTSMRHHIFQRAFFIGLIKKNIKHTLLIFLNYFTSNLLFNSWSQYVTIDIYNASRKGGLQ